MTILVIRARCLSPGYWLAALMPEKWNKCQFVEIYVLIRSILIFLALYFHAILYETPFWLQLAITFCICWLIIGSLFHPLAVVTVDKYRKEEAKTKVHSYFRSFILLFVNYVEIIIGFAYLYLHLELVRPSDCSTPINTVDEALYFSVVTITTLGYGDMRPLPGLGRFCASIEPLMGFVLLILVLGLLFVELGKTK